MFKYMDYVYAVYKEMNFSKAAANMHIAQSALSMTIKKAESQLGLPIFNRQTSPITLTPFGEKYINSIEIIQEQKAILDKYIYDINHQKTGNLSIGASTFWSTYLVSPAILAFNKDFPNIRVNLYEDITITLIKSFIASQIDILITSSEVNSVSYNKITLCEETLLLVVPKKLTPKHIKESYKLNLTSTQNYLNDCPSLSLLEFSGLPFVLLRDGNTSRTLADEALFEAGVHPHIVLELDQAVTAYRLACLGIGATLVSDLNILVTGQNDNVDIFKINTPLLRRNVYLYTKKDSIFSSTMDAFIATMKDINAQWHRF